MKNKILSLYISNFTLNQLLNNNVHLGFNSTKKDPFSFNVILKVREKILIINMLKTSLYLKIFFNNFINVFYNNHFILLTDCTLDERNIIINNCFFYNKYILSIYNKWKVGSITNYINIQFFHKMKKIIFYKKEIEKEKKIENKIFFNDKIYNIFEKNSFQYIFPNFVYNLFSYKDFVINETSNKSLPLISFLDSDLISAKINYLGIPGNNDSVSSLIFYKDILYSILKLSIIKNIYIFNFYIIKKKKYINIFNYKKLITFYN